MITNVLALADQLSFNFLGDVLTAVHTAVRKISGLSGGTVIRLKRWMK
jgi:hypothetical protein